MIRSILAVTTGFVSWIVAATLGSFLIGALLPGYVAAEPTMSFTLAMMVARLALAVVSSIVAGFACSAVARGACQPPHLSSLAAVTGFGGGDDPPDPGEVLAAAHFN